MSCDSLAGARAPGDIIIGGLFPIHEKVKDLSSRTQPDELTCEDFHTRGFVRSLAMIYTIESINNSTLLPGIKLGYEIYDTCADVSKAIPAALRFISKLNATNRHVEVICNYSGYTPAVKAVVGATYSEVSIAVSRVLSFFLIPQVSYVSSASILSDRVRFPSFFRTVPSDKQQMKALALLASEFEWNWIGVVTSDDDYGRTALEDFLTEVKNRNICTAFQEYLPSYVGHENVLNRTKKIVKKIITDLQILQEIKNINFSQNDGPFYFDDNGDSVNGYDLINWQKINNSMEFVVLSAISMKNACFIEM
ncbi:G-protein coupled receptor family C group 6 member A [Latimeria chalumnae]|uniref:G-protein coupled receptor family C group 6 member A n=1 Tax=Latimeria chalumnae TaxID=7897 RepID=UPI00313B6567